MIRKISIQFLLTFLACLSFPSHSEVYKCTGVNGEIRYQSNECSEDSESKIMNVKEFEVRLPKEISTETQSTKSSPSIDEKDLSKDKQQQSKKQKAMLCKSLRKKYRTLSEQEKKRCKKSRDSGCDRQPAHVSALKRFEKKHGGAGMCSERSLGDGHYYMHCNNAKPQAKPQVVQVYELLKAYKCSF